MISLNTNLSSIIVQRSLINSTKGLNQAIERLSTGFKINHASDNAANYSISTDYSTKISAYDIAEDNVSMGVDLLSVAEDNLDQMQDNASSLRSIIMTAVNGTYGDTSLSALTAQAQSLVDNMKNIYNSASYNGIKLLAGGTSSTTTTTTAGTTSTVGPTTTAPTPSYNGFIDNPVDYTDAQVATMQTLDDALFVSGDYDPYDAERTYSITTLSELETFREAVNDGTIVYGKFVLGADIDLGSVASWKPIGDDANCFQGTFNGNGHTISNLTISASTNDFIGLFGYCSSDSTIKNVGIENCNITGKSKVGALVGCTQGTIDNCYATGTVTGTDGVGGLAGCANGTISNSYATGTVTGTDGVGGLAGATGSSIDNSYATGTVTGQTDVGGLAGYAGGTIQYSYAIGDVTNTGTGNNTGGLAGYAGGTIQYSYATGNVDGEGDYVGGLVGSADGTIQYSYATGDVKGNDSVGGLAGLVWGTISNSYSTGDVSGNTWVGGLAGSVDCRSGATVQNSASYAKSVTGTDKVGSFIGGLRTITGTVGTLTFENNKCTEIEGLEKISGVYDGSDTKITYDLTSVLNGIEYITITEDNGITIQCGIYGKDSSSINFTSRISSEVIDKLDSIMALGIDDADSLDLIDEFIEELDSKSTDLGAVQNRLESALEEISIHYENLVSSQSTIKDADMAKESSNYVKYQILQEASETLLVVANQEPAIALTLLGVNTSGKSYG